MPVKNNKKIVWIASYPKSGNTWFRMVLTNLFSEKDTPAGINEILPTPIASSREQFDELTGISSSDLTENEIDTLRGEAYRELAKHSPDIIYKKVHDAWKRTLSGKEIFPHDVTRAVVYLVRNPLDIAISYAHHSNISYEKSVTQLNDRQHAMCSGKDRQHNQLKQVLGNWTDHVRGWIDESGLPVVVLRYEDLLTDPFNEFERAINFIGLTPDHDKLEQAIRFSSFEMLSNNEQTEVFKEKPIKMQSFFREGNAGQWRKLLSNDLVKSITEHHREYMQRFGYLKENQPV